ncbi:MAG: PspC domain-containing protein [Dysgonamonadaceae bacterium]|jgi:phage shock protein PspC (stress-responsive transcriptional regulator)|nr:PspC domain-containing protein [Dysgonamonadaceae bacterium]
MKKVININFQGQVIAIEETAYDILKQYIDSLKRYFSREECGEEIVNDIESRIAELFGNRLKLGIPCITDEDVEAVITSIGKPEDFDANYEEVSANAEEKFSSDKENTNSTNSNERCPLFRNTNDKIIGGVCSGLADYFKIDPILVRLVFVLCFSFSWIAYIVLWIVLKPKDLGNNGGKKLYRNKNEKMIGGVCSGIANYFQVDPTLVRVIVVVFASVFYGVLWGGMQKSWSFPFIPVFLYLILWILMTPEYLKANAAKRLYRSPNNRFIAGVCGGIATYFKIDAWIPRLFFLLPFIFYMLTSYITLPFWWQTNNTSFQVRYNIAFFAVYFILWIIIPKAKTVKQKLEMLGEEDYIKSIRETVSDNVSNVKNRAENETEHEASYCKEEKPSATNIRNNAKYKTSFSQPERSGCLKAIVVFFKIIFFAFIGLVGMVLLAVFVALMFTGAQLCSLKSLFIDAGTETILLWFSASLLLIVPIAAIIVWVIRRSMQAKSRPVIGIVALLLWLSGVVLSGVLASNIVSKFKDEGSYERNITISPISTGKMILEMLPYNDDFSVIKTGFGPGAETHDLPYLTVNEDSLLWRNINLQIRETSDSLFSVRTIVASRGRDLRSAQTNARQITYNIVQKDSLLLLPEFLSIPVSQGFRDQSVTIEILVPAGKSLEVSDELNRFKRNAPPKVVRRRIN